MGLFNRASRHSGGHGDGHGPATEGRESRDTDLGAELAELGELVPERTEGPVPSSSALAPEASALSRDAQRPNRAQAEPVSDVADELEAAEESGSPEVEAKVEAPVVPTSEPELEAETETTVDPDADRISFADALSPRRGAISAGTPDEPKAEKPIGTAKVISFANQKGGVAKTTTTLNLAVAFAESGLRVLCIDLDPQGNLTMSQGIDPDKVEKSMYDVLVHHIPLSEVIQHREIDIAVASIDLAGAEIAMSTQIGRERSLEKAIRGVQNDYDFVCIDTPPSLGLLTVNALTASDSVVVPVQCEYLSMRGLMQLNNTLEMIRENLNPRVQIEGILPTMLDSRTVHAKEAVELLEENFGELVFKSRIRKAIKFAEAPVRGASVLKYDPKSNAADYYRELAKEVLTLGAK
ncbi:MAG: AAA family ATPase [Actinomycetota bacterium]|nr:AAA family ATPase [Actinomycetota bacterium]